MEQQIPNPFHHESSLEPGSAGGLAPATRLSGSGESAIADEAINSILGAPDHLIDHPRLGERVDRYVGREIRHLFVDDYELHHEVAFDLILIIRVWHMREDHP